MMQRLIRLVPLLLAVLGLGLVLAGPGADHAWARAKRGGRSFRSTPRRTPPPPPPRTAPYVKKKSGFGRGLAGGLLGGALGAMLFGSLFGAGGSGIGLLPLLILGAVGYFLYKRFRSMSAAGSAPGMRAPPGPGMGGPGMGAGAAPPPPFPGTGGMDAPPPSGPEAGLAAIQAADPSFDASGFIEWASDVFFQVQAGWARRDVAPIRHLLGDRLAAEYEAEFQGLRAAGRINRLENISVRGAEIVDAGIQGAEEFVTVRFTANLLDYTVDEATGQVVEGSDTQPVKFVEEWTWARPAGSRGPWRLEGVR